MNAQYVFWCGIQIWNQPVRSVELTIEEMESLFEAKMEMERNNLKAAILEAISEIDFQ